MTSIGQSRMYEIQQQNIQAFKTKVESGQINKDSTFVIKRYDKISDTVANILLAKGITNPTAEQIQEVKTQLLSNSDISGTIKAKNAGEMDLHFLKEGKSIDMSKIHVTENTSATSLSQEQLSELHEQLNKANNDLRSDLTQIKPKEGSIDLTDEQKQKIENDIFKQQMSNMSKKQLKQFAENSNDIEKLKMISQELGVRGKQHSAREVAQKVKLLEGEQSQSKQVQSEAVPLSNGKPPATGPSAEENPQYDAIARGQSQSVKPQQNTDIPVTTTTSTAQTKSKSLNEQQLKEYLDNDSTYQTYTKKFGDMDKRMTELENKAGINRNDPVDLNIFKLSDNERHEYTSLSLTYKGLKSDLEDYKNRMQNWQDGKKWNHVTASRNYLKQEWSNVETITLKNGQHAYKSDQGVFYPGPDGGLTFDSAPVPKELLE